ncbi:hypothetical protein [Labedaea rhizosphaerae]|uniref:Metalloprotease n=1 Tax=Labedaea rhizosphaerae TaxID=598644 RepID=A0A4V3CXY8_LABRH|nr:hypothetical protein [Labedaea rhizosphaerae]TDP92128.1 hypothetical protein EV186_108341 [Labedaea rhizosphaerae]
MTTPEDPSWQDPTRFTSDEPTQRVDTGATQWLGPPSEPTTVWQQPQQQPTWEEQQRATPPDQLEPVGKHVLIALAIVLVIALLGVAAFFTLRHNATTAAPPPQTTAPQVPTFTSDTQEPVTTTTPEPTTTTSTVDDPAQALAQAPLSTSGATMSPSTCALPRFDLPDAKQAQFFQAAKKCADNAWGATLPGAGIPTAAVNLVTVQGSAVQTSCGKIGPSDPSTECQGTVYMTPAYLRDVQGNGRYPGKYFGTFLREYGHALQDANGMTELYKAARSQPGADADDLDRRYNDQAICLAGIASGAMSGKGAVDSNITNEIRERITTGEPAPADAGSWLDKGFSSRTLSACNTWQG